MIINCTNAFMTVLSASQRTIITEAATHRIVMFLSFALHGVTKGGRNIQLQFNPRGHQW